MAFVEKISQLRKALTMHMRDKNLRDLAHSQALLSRTVWLGLKLANGSFSAVDHCRGMSAIARWLPRPVNGEHTGGSWYGYGYALHSEPLPSGSTTRLEQLRVSVGPPPLVVPMKVTVMLLDMVERVDLWRKTVEWMQSGLDRKSTRLNSSHSGESRMPSSA